MKFGKLPDISSVSFDLPPQSERSLLVLGEKPASAKLEVLTGAPVWSKRNWIGKIYPKGSKPAQFLSLYSQNFRTVELNVTHYQIPRPELVTKWYEAADPAFRFCPKIPQEISHRRKLTNCSERLSLFCERISAFREKLGCCFLQLPPGFGPDSLFRLEHFLAEWPQNLPLAVEFRHADWFAAGELLPEACDLLESFRISSVITDVAGRRDVSHSSLTSPTAMIRFVGNDLHASDYSRIEAWVERIALWHQNGLQGVYFFIHQPEETHSPELLAHFADRLNARLDLSIKMPALRQAESGQLGLFG